MKKKTILFVFIGMIAFMQGHSQIINQFKVERPNYTYIQFPTEDVRKSVVTIEVIQENLLGNVAEKVIKNEAIAGALTGKGGILGDESTTTTLKLIPPVFPTTGELYAEVTYSGEFSSAKTKDLPKETYNQMDNGQKIQAVVSYKVFEMPEKKLIYTQDKIWVMGMMAKPSSGTTSGSAMESATKNMVSGWAKRKLDMQYGIGNRTSELAVYMIKKQEKEDKKIAEDIQEKMVECVSTIKAKRQSSEYMAKVDECIAHYNKMLKKYQPGTTKQKEALVTDNNVWCLYYNLAVAYMIKGDKAESQSYIEKASKIRVIKVFKEITNKEGEKVGQVQGGIPSGYYEISVMKDLSKNYFAGLENMDERFVKLLNSPELIRKASNLAREWGSNSMLSLMYGLESPANFVDRGIEKEGLKAFSGTVSAGDITIDYNGKKALLFPISFSNLMGYTIKLSGPAGIAKSSYYSSNLLSNKTYYTNSYSLYEGDDSYAKLASKIAFAKKKNADKTTCMPYLTIQYDYNGDIIINNYLVKDKSFYYKYLKLSKDEALGCTEGTMRIETPDYETIASIKIDVAEIERERTMKFFEAFLQKKMAPAEPIPTTETANNKKSNTIKGSSIQNTTGDKGNITETKTGKHSTTRSYIYK